MRLKCQPGSKTQEVYLQPLQSSEHLPYILELNYLRENHSEVVKATKAAELALRLKVSEHDALKKLLEKQTSLNDGSQSHINRARAEKDKLLAADQHMGEMEVENSIQYVSPDVDALICWMVFSMFLFDRCVIETEKSCGRCQEGWVLLNTSCYFFSNVLTNQPIKKNWPDSRQDCISRKADLVVIESWEEQVRPPWGLWVEFIVLSNHSRPAASGTSLHRSVVWKWTSWKLSYMYALFMQDMLNDNVPKITTSGWWASGFWMGLTEISVDNRWVWTNNVTLQPPL